MSDQDEIKDAATEIRDQAAADAEEMAASETLADRIKSEAAATKNQSTINALSRVDASRLILHRAYDTYRHSVDGALKQLQSQLGGDAEVDKTIKAVADAYDLTLDTKGRKQPKPPKA